MIRCREDNRDQTVAAGHSVEVDPARWQAGLEARGIGYVLVVACDHSAVAGGGTYR
jgi:hypothetical protein